MKLHSTFLLIFTGTILFVAACSSQNGSANEAWRWVHYGSETGLPSIPVYCMAEGKDSTMWIGTGKGVLWFDGYQWHTVDSSMGIPQSYCNELYCLQESGDIVAHIVPVLYQGNKFGFKKIVDDFRGTCIPFDGHSLLIRIDSMLCLFENGETRPSKEYPSIFNSAPEQTLWVTSVGHPWLLARGGLYVWNNGKWNCRINMSHRQLVVTNVIEQPDQTVILTITGPGERLGVWELSPSNKLTYRNPCTFYSKIAVDSTFAGHMYALSLADKIQIFHENKLFQILSLPVEGLKIFSLFYDHKGDLWIGTSEGLFCYHSRSTRWQSLDSPKYRDENVLELIRARDGRLWAGTQHGINIYSGDTLVHSIGKINGVTLSAVTGLIEDNDGNIWISSGSAFQGTFRWDGAKWTHLNIGRKGEGIFVHKIRKDRRGRLWFLGLGTYFVAGKQPGAFVFDNGLFEHMGEEDGLLNGRVYSFGQSSDSALWFGTASGLSRRKDGKWTHWIGVKDFNFVRVFALAIDADDNVWLSDRRNEVGCLHPDKRITYYDLQSGLPDSIIWDIKVDSANVVWFTSEKGLAAFKNGTWTTYDSRSGLVKFPLWPVLPLGKEVYIGTLGNGVILLHPDECVQPPPKIIIENSIVEGGDVLLRWRPLAFQGEPSPANIPTRFRINNDPWSPWGTTHEAMLRQLSSGSYFFQVQAKNLFGLVDSAGQMGFFTIAPPFYYRSAFLFPVGILLLAIVLFSVSYVVSIKKRDTALSKSEDKFRRLTESTFDGILIYDQGRILEANERLARMFGYEPSEFLNIPLSNLLSEDFQAVSDKESIYKPLEISGMRKDGSKIWVEIVGQNIPYGGATARIAAIRNITDRKLAEERLLQYKEELKALALQLSSTEERERREVATYLHDYISQALGFCKMKLGTMTGRITDKDIHEVRGYIEDMFEKTQSLTFELSPPILYELGLEAALGSLADRMQAQYGLVIHFESGDEPVNMNEKIKLFLFYSIRELLINVEKHAGATEVCIRMLTEDQMMRISVIDDGKGFSKAQKKIKRKLEGGFGLFNIQERLSHFGGRLDIVPRADHGTIVTLMVPLEQNENEPEGISQ